MQFSFSEDQLALREAVRQVLDRECTPAHLRAVAAGEVDGHRWGVLAQLGAPGLLVAEDAGGLGMGEVELVGVMEEAGRAALPEPLAETAALAVPLLAAALGGAEPASAGAAEALAAIAGGELVVGTGGVEVDRHGPRTTSAAAPDGTLTTERVVGASSAGILVLVAGGGGAPGAWEVHSVPIDDAEVRATASIDPTRDVSSVLWRPSPATLVLAGEPAAAAVGALCDRAALVSAAQLLGLADRMLTLAADYAKVRVQFGRPIGSFQAVKHHLAGAKVRLDFARPVTYRAADSVARSLPARGVHASMAKALASDAADLAARVALQVHGAIGYTWECDLHLYMKRAWALSAAWGDAQSHRAMVLAAALAGRGERPIW